MRMSGSASRWREGETKGERFDPAMFSLHSVCMRRALLIAAACFSIVLVVFLSTIVVHSFLPSQPIGEIRYIDLISVVLTALSIMITVLGLFVAALGVIGWTTFESKLRDNSFSYFTSELSKDGNLRKEFEQLLTELSLQGVKPEGVQVTDGAEVTPNEERRYDD